MNTKLMPGVVTPGIRIETVDGEPWNLNDAKAPHFLMLIFYRGNHCKICQRYLKRFDSLAQKFQDHGVEIVAISGDDEETAKKSVSEWGIERLRVGYGLTEAQMADWGLYISQSIKDEEPDTFSEPGLFLIETRDFKLRYAALNSMPFGRPDPEEMLDSVKLIIEENYPARGTQASPTSADIFSAGADS